MGGRQLKTSCVELKQHLHEHERRVELLGLLVQHGVDIPLIV